MTREEMVGKLISDEERQHYTTLDGSRIDYAGSKLCASMVGVIDSLAAYASAILEEECSPEDIGYSRREAIEKWAEAQASLSQLAYVMRFNGDEAYSRYIQFKEDEDVRLTMEGL